MLLKFCIYFFNQHYLSANCFHLRTSTPFITSHSIRLSSATNGVNKITGIKAPANDGKRSKPKLLTAVILAASNVVVDLFSLSDQTSWLNISMHQHTNHFHISCSVIKKSVPNGVML